MIVVTTDLHFTLDPKDEYRWGLFRFLKGLCEKYKATDLLILGDLTDAKDNHSAVLTNRIADGIATLSDTAFVTILAGNHDYSKGGFPFFKFLDIIPAVTFVTSTEVMYFGDRMRAVMVPHSPTIEKDLVRVQEEKYPSADVLFTHYSFKGAVYSNGDDAREGLPPSFPSGIKVYSGDIHVPQRLKDVTYIGSPYHTHFNDSGPRRVVVIDPVTSRILAEEEYPCPRRYTVRVDSLEDLYSQFDSGKIVSGDQIKIVVRDPPHNRANWTSSMKSIKEACSRNQVDLCGLLFESPVVVPEGMRSSESRGVSRSERQVIEQFCAEYGVEGRVADVGEGLLDAD